MQFIKKALRRVAVYLYMVPLRILCRLQSTATTQGKPKALQPTMTPGQGVVIFNGKVHIGYFPSPYFFNRYAHIESRNKEAVIEIGNGTWINNNFVAIAEHSNIKIGNRVLIGPNVIITDSDFHGLKIEDRSLSKPCEAKSVSIGDDVFIGSNVTILKGVTIGRGSVIGSNSVITKDIPCNVIAAGSPARIIRPL